MTTTKSLSREDVTTTIQGSPDIAGVEQAVPAFTQVRDYTTFRAEWAAIDGDFVVHFFLSVEQMALSKKAQERYWLQEFPAALSDTAERYFLATKPRLTAQYTDELSSWYFRARGFADVLDPASFINGFMLELDRFLDANS